MLSHFVENFFLGAVFFQDVWISFDATEEKITSLISICYVRNALSFYFVKKIASQKKFCHHFYLLENHAKFTFDEK
jgi:hypothetical protein